MGENMTKVGAPADRRKGRNAHNGASAKEKAGRCRPAAPGLGGAGLFRGIGWRYARTRLEGWGSGPAIDNRPSNIRPSRTARKRCLRMGAMRATQWMIIKSVIPALSRRDEKIAKDLNARDVFQFFRVNQITVEFRHVRLGKNADEI